MFPGNSPVFIRARRLHDKLFAGKFVHPRQVFADKAPNQCAFDVKDEVVSGFVNLIRAKGGLVAALRVLHRRSIGSFLRLACGFRYITWTDMWPSRV